jgi:uncharacterized protein
MILRILFLLSCLCAWPGRALADNGWQLPGEPATVEQELRFANGDVPLAGTLYLPAGGGRVPAVVVTHGAAMPTRDYRLYTHLTQALPAMGIAVLVYDRRGSGGSGNGKVAAGFELLADDAIAGQHALARHPRIDPARIGFWGLSQGGWLAVLAANRSPDAAFAVSVSAPLVTPDIQMNYATANMLTLHGYGAQDVQQELAARHAYDAYTRGQLARPAAQQALAAAERQPWFPLAFLATAQELSPTPRETVWYKQMQHDPLVEVGKARVPVLFLYGGADPWVPVGVSIARLRTLMPTHPQFAWQVIGGVNHTMQREAHEMMAFDDAAMRAQAPDAPEYFAVLAKWLARQTR